MEEKGLEVNCSLFSNKEFMIRRFGTEIGSALDVNMKMSKAFILMRELNALLSCKDYNDENPECRNCHRMASWRATTLEIIFEHEKRLIRSIEKLERISTCMGRILNTLADAQGFQRELFTNGSQSL